MVALRAAALLSAIAAALAAPPAFALNRSTWRQPPYNTSSGILRGAINVHLQPHSHNDLGWLKTEFEYLVGSNMSIQAASVQSIYDSVLAELQLNPDRSFHSVEMGFLLRYLEARPLEQTAVVQQLLARGQLTLTNAGWVMADEACGTWIEMSDQLSLGHRLVASMLGPAALPRVASSADPFGHGATQGSHFTSLAGMSAFFYGRMDMEERALRWNTSASEYVWRPSGTLGSRAQSLAGFNIHGYDPPPMPDGSRSPFYFDINEDAQPSVFGPVQDNPDWKNVNTASYVAATLAIAAAHAEHILPDADGTVHLAWQLGTDFTLRQAGEWYRSLDKLIHYVNLNTSLHGVNLLYSSPTRYADAKLAQDIAWPLKTDDQYPYWGDQKHWTWTGYFSSRPAFKGYVRACAAYYAAARQLQAFSGGAPGTAGGLDARNPLFRLERALGTAMHHDAVTGTERQHVAFDYAASLAAGRADAALLMDAALSALTGYAPAGGGWATCEFANATIACASLEAGAPTLLLVYNSQSQPRAAQPVRVPVGLPPGVASWSVTAPDGVTALQAQLLPASRRDVYLREDYYAAPAAPGAGMHWLAWLAPTIPALGFAAFFLQPSATALAATHLSRATRLSAHGADAQLSNGAVTLTIAAATGMLAAYADNATGVAFPLTQEFLWYNASTGNAPNDGTGGSSWGQPATTYIFRPNSSTPFAVRGAAAADVEVLTGPVLSEARQYMGGGDWVTNVLRLWAGASTVESEWTVGPIPIADGEGKEVIMRLAAGAGGSWQPAPGAAVLWSDANGLEMQRRVLNERPSWNSSAYEYEPVASNYYPVTARAFIEDAAGLRLSLAPDRAQGCASLAPGALECMLHRRLLVDAFLGNGEALNEPGLDAAGRGLPARGHAILAIDTPARKAAAGHALALDAAAPLVVLAAPLDAAPAAWLAAAPGRAATFSALAAPLPPALHIMTVQSLGAGELLLRVQHLFEAGEAGAGNASVALARIFAPAAAGFTVAAATEMSLPGALPLASVKPWTLRVRGEPGAGVTLPVIPAPPAGADLAIELAAGDIRTFVLALA